MTAFDRWIGRSDERHETISPVPLRLLAATLDLPRVEPMAGEPIPPMWHWLYHLPDAVQSELGEDGHPRRGRFYPQVPLRRRMFAGGRVTIHQPLRVGETAVRRREIVSVDEKEGSSGPLVLVDVRHDIEGSGGSAITEHQTIVYTDSPPDPVEDEGDPPDDPWQQELETDPVLLFRFSALTFNAHRIHYDLPYAVEVEGYPGLVVHGPLILILLAEMARHHGLEATSVRFRARAPVYAGDVLQLRGTPERDGARVGAYRRGRLAMEATIGS